MARYVANVDILTETFETWLLRTNTLLHALSTEIITANSTWANTGNTSVPRNAQLYGRFVSNSIYISDNLSGGSNTTTTANLNITSNVSITGATVNSAANSRYTNTAFFEANVQANGALVTIFPLGNTNARATELTVNTNTITVRGGNVVVKSNTSINALTVVNDTTTTNTTINGNNFISTANVVVSGLNHTIAGNTNFDSGSLFVDGTNNRVGVGTTTPTQQVHVYGTGAVEELIQTTSILSSAGIRLQANVSIGGMFVYGSGVSNQYTNNNLFITTTHSGGGLLFGSNTAMIRMVVAANGNVGVGNTDPSLLFQVSTRGGMDSAGVFYWGDDLTGNNRGYLTYSTDRASIVAAANLVFGSGNTAAKMILDSTGNVGIGTTSAVATLTIGGVAGSDRTIQIGSAGATRGVISTDGTNGIVSIGATNDSTTGRLAFLTGASLTERIRIDENGNTGINTTTPNARLAVIGTANISANTWIGGNVTIAGISHVIGGNVNFDTGTLFVDSVNNRVGFNTTTPNATVAVNGTANITGAAYFANVVAIVGAATLSNTMQVTGAANALSTFGVTGAANALSTFGVTGLTTLAGNVNTTVANASIAVNVGANVQANTTALFVGNSTVNTVITSTNIGGVSNAQLNIVNVVTANASTLIGVGANVQANTTALFVGNSTVNTVITSTNIGGQSNAQLNVVNASIFNGPTVNASSVVNIGANVQANTTALFVGNSTVNTVITSTNIGGMSNAQLNVVNTVTVNASSLVGVGANVQANTTTIRVGNTTSYTSLTQTTIATTGTLNVTGDAGFTSNVSVGGTLQTSVLNVTSSLVLEGDYTIDISSNTNIGSNTAPQKVYEFAKANYSSGKLMVQIKNGANTQMSEMVIAHNGTDAYVTVYATVGAPPSANVMTAPLGTFTTTINSTSNAVELFLQQTVSNSAVKVVAHLIK